MRTTIRFDEHLLRDVKTYAARTGQTLTAVVDEALRKLLAERSRPKRRIDLPVHRGKGLQPGVDLDDSASLWDLLEENDRPL